MPTNLIGATGDGGFTQNAPTMTGDAALGAAGQGAQTLLEAGIRSTPNATLTEAGEPQTSGVTAIGDPVRIRSAGGAVPSSSKGPDPSARPERLAPSNLAITRSEEELGGRCPVSHSDTGV